MLKNSRRSHPGPAEGLLLLLQLPNGEFVSFGKYINPAALSYDQYIRYKELNGNRDWLPVHLRPSPPQPVSPAPAAVMIPSDLIAAQSYARSAVEYLDKLKVERYDLYTEGLSVELDRVRQLAADIVANPSAHPIQCVRNGISDIQSMIEEADAGDIVNSNIGVPPAKQGSKRGRYMLTNGE